MEIFLISLFLSISFLSFQSLTFLTPAKETCCLTDDLCFELCKTWFCLDIIVTGRSHVTYHRWFKMASPCVSLSDEEQVCSKCHMSWNWSSAACKLIFLLKAYCGLRKTHFWPQPNLFTNTNKFEDELIRFRMLNGEAHSDFTWYITQKTITLVISTHSPQTSI